MPPKSGHHDRPAKRPNEDEDAELPLPDAMRSPGGHMWRSNVRGRAVPSDVADSSFRPDAGDAISGSGNISPGWVARQRKHELLNSQLSDGSTQFSELPMPKPTPQVQEDNDDDGPNPDNGVFKLPDLGQYRAHIRGGRQGMGSQQVSAGANANSRRSNAASDDAFEALRDVRAQMPEQVPSSVGTPVRTPSERQFMPEQSSGFGGQRLQTPIASSGGFQSIFGNPNLGFRRHMPPTSPLQSMEPLRSSPPLARSQMPPDEDEDPASQPFDARLRGRMRYDYALGSGCLAAVVLARIHATQLGHPLPASLSDAQWRITGRNILWSMPRILLDTLVTGNLARKYHCGNDMLVELFDDSEWAHEATLIAPMVYTVILSTTGMGPGRGLSPTPDQLRLVIGMLRGYVSQHPDTFDVALQVDNAFGRVHSTENDLYQGHHHFLTATKNGVRKPVRGRIDIVTQFCDGLEARLDRMPEDQEEEPLKHALQYIGYAFNYSAREKDHMRGGSAFLMHLVKHVCQVLYPREFNLETFPLCFLAKEDEVCLAELLLTQLADSFHTTGGGFNAHPPGLNNTSAEMKDWVKEDWEGFWRDRRETRVGMGFWEQARCEEMDVLERGGMGPSEAASEGSMGTQQAMLSAVQAESKDLENASRDFDREAKQEEEAVVHRLERIAAHEALEGPEYAEVREWMLKRLC